ncbi:MAG: hypothetical protein ACYDEX_02215 [Mobilitalea sp.]
MNNKAFLKNVGDLLKGDNVIFLMYSCGRNLIIEREEGIRLFSVSLYIVMPGINAFINKRFIAAFSIKDFINECDRLHLNYVEMLATMTKDLVRELW